MKTIVMMLCVMVTVGCVAEEADLSAAELLMDSDPWDQGGPDDCQGTSEGCQQTGDPVGSPAWCLHIENWGAPECSPTCSEDWYTGVITWASCGPTLQVSGGYARVPMLVCEHDIPGWCDFSDASSNPDWASSCGKTYQNVIWNTCRYLQDNEWTDVLVNKVPCNLFPNLCG